MKKMYVRLLYYRPNKPPLLTDHPELLPLAQYNMAALHKTDPIGARDLADEAGKDLGFKQPDSNRPTAGKATTSERSRSNGADPSMLVTVNVLELIRIPHEDPSTSVPNAHMMYTVISAMDELMLTDRYWSTRALRWSPIVSRIYYGTLFMISIFRCMVHSGTASPAIRSLRRDFKADFPYESLPIAGPVMLFFTALAVCHPPNMEYGIVSLSVPDGTGANIATNQALSLLPNLTGLRRAYNRSRHIVVNNAQDWDFNLNTDQPHAIHAPIGLTVR